ncbi:UNVERIFIED_CONTAM: Nuclear transport factor 2 [Sesamum latifolium]|uniref:Nuclear transport factor 2 n=1 Tax=Sesamum latifolium TaxID=2727402 RepID=A0AAW2X9B8_9LAMI
MATQTANLPPAPSAQVVGNAFVEQYYHILHHSPELVFRFYQDTSVLSRPDADGLMTTVTTMQSINDKICSLDYKNYKAEIKTADAQDSYKDGVIVLVTGCLTGKDNLRRKFTQTFFLAPQDKGYYVLNDVFRYVEESEPDISSGVVLGVNETPSSSLGQDPEPAQVVDPPNANDATSTADEIETNEEKTGDQVIDERQASSDRDILVEAESHLNENHESAVAESVPSASQEDVPKKSYASIVSSQAKKGPTKVYVPANPAKGTSAKTESQPVNPVTEASDSEAAAPVPPDNAQESEDAEDEVEGHSIYIRNLPLNATVAQLEAEFKKFGTIKPNGVQVRSNKQQGFCFGFVEFQDLAPCKVQLRVYWMLKHLCHVYVRSQKAFTKFSGLSHLIVQHSYNWVQSKLLCTLCFQQASPITIGDRQAAVEIKGPPLELAVEGVVLLLHVEGSVTTTSGAAETLAVVGRMSEMITSGAEETSAAGTVEKVINKEEGEVEKVINKEEEGGAVVVTGQVRFMLQYREWEVRLRVAFSDCGAARLPQNARHVVIAPRVRHLQLSKCNLVDPTLDFPHLQ